MWVRATPPAIPELNFIKLLGDNVWKAQHRRSGEKLVVKGPVPERGITEEDIKLEETIIRYVRQHLLDHPHSRVTLDNILKPVKLRTNPGQYLVTRYISASTLDEESFYRLPTILGAIIDLSDIVSRTHKANIIINDLQSDNWLYVPGLKVPYVLTDCGEATFRPPLELSGKEDRICRGSPGFTSPDVLAGFPDRRADSFTLGALLYYLITGKELFEGKLPKKPNIQTEESKVKYHVKLRATMHKALESGQYAAAMRWRHRPVSEQVQEIFVGATNPDKFQRWTLMQIREGCLAALPAHMREHYALTRST